VRPTLATRRDTRAAANAALRIDEHCLFHIYSPVSNYFTA
jgi:hypothetical protein